MFFRIRLPWLSAAASWRENPHLESFAFYDTAGSVKQLVELRDRRAGAIASEAAARYYGAQVLASGIEDNPEVNLHAILLFAAFCGSAAGQRRQ